MFNREGLFACAWWAESSACIWEFNLHLRVQFARGEVCLSPISAITLLCLAGRHIACSHLCGVALWGSCSCPVGRQALKMAPGFQVSSTIGTLLWDSKLPKDSYNELGAPSTTVLTLKKKNLEGWRGDYLEYPLRQCCFLYLWIKNYKLLLGKATNLKLGSWNGM